MTLKPSRLLQEADSVVRNRQKQIEKYKSHKSAVIFSVQTGKQKCLRRRTSLKASVLVLEQRCWKTYSIKMITRIFVNVQWSDEDFFLHIVIFITICQFLCFSFFNLLLGQSGSSSLHVFLVFFLVQDHLSLGLLLQALLDHLLPVPPRNQQ